jgi:hypothetical protein
VAGLGVRSFTDEMTDPDLAVALRQRGYDSESCQAAHRYRYNTRKLKDRKRTERAIRQKVGKRLQYRRATQGG